MSRRSPPLLFPLHDGYLPTWRGSPHHMTPSEAKLLHLWLDTKPEGLCELWYDVPMDGVPGQQATPEREHPIFGQALNRMWQRLTSKRADAIARYGSLYQVIELRPIVKAQTIGEVHTYQALATAEWPELQWLPPLVVTAYLGPMEYKALIAGGIRSAVLSSSVSTPI